MPNTFIFDFFGVICSEIAPFWLRRYFSDEEANAIKSNIVGKADTGAITCEEMYQQLGEIAHVSPSQVEAEWYDLAVIDAQVVNLVHVLKSTYRVVLLSNAPAPFLYRLLEANQLTSLFETITVSSEQHIAKPDPAIYMYLLQELGINAQDAIMIDDNPRNVAGAQNVGIQGIHYTDYKKLCEDLREYGV
ncbi:MAG: HAD-IA family hydrolase [Coriobacteriales bacterium]|nr:HAD-IA family hydrolase [Coriobacteriales bacterium]